MASRVSYTTIGCLDAYALSEWWKPVRGCHDVVDGPNEPVAVPDTIADPVGNEFCVVRRDEERLVS